MHRDVKSANILLDENWNAKISDFGLSKKGPNVPASFVSSNPCGTRGYICPEYESNRYLTTKADVFSFGVVLFEVLCGRPAYVAVDDQPFNIWVQKHYTRKTLNTIIHSGVHEQINPASLHTFSTIAYQCLKNGEERPTMKEVVEQLQKALDDQLVSCCTRLRRCYIFFVIAFYFKTIRSGALFSTPPPPPPNYIVRFWVLFLKKKRFAVVKTTLCTC
ncbi:putative protein kinase RLK-Pelle-CrRLK1L-1 family [Helianthus anomalus]